jgi:hypothetical protein
MSSSLSTPEKGFSLMSWTLLAASLGGGTEALAEFALAYHQPVYACFHHGHRWPRRP